MEDETFDNIVIAIGNLVKFGNDRHVHFDGLQNNGKSTVLAKLKNLELGIGSLECIIISKEIVLIC